MFGLILVQLQKFIQRSGGPFAWQLVRRECDLPPGTYLPNQAYPDGEAMALVMAASRIFMQSPGDFLEDFGKFLAPELLSLYSDRLDPRWTMFDLLERVHQIFHGKVSRDFPGLMPPTLVMERLGPHRALVSYSSPRNLCQIARGIVVGVGNLYQQEVALREPECTLRGDAQCVFDISLLSDRKKQQVSFAHHRQIQIIQASLTDLALLMLWAAGEWINPCVTYATIQSLLEAVLTKLSSQLNGDATIGLDVPTSFVSSALKLSFAPSQRIHCMKGFSVPRLHPPDANVVSATSVPAQSIADYDAQCFKMRRDSVIASVLAEAGSSSWVYVDGTEIRGVCLSGPSRIGIRIFYLIAETHEIASALLHRCLADFPSEAIFLDMPLDNSSAVALGQEFGMVEVFVINRMYKGVDPRFDYSRIYGVSLNGIL